MLWKCRLPVVIGALRVKKRLCVHQQTDILHYWFLTVWQDSSQRRQASTFYAPEPEYLNYLELFFLFWLVSAFMNNVSIFNLMTSWNYRDKFHFNVFYWCLTINKSYDSLLLYLLPQCLCVKRDLSQVPWFFPHTRLVLFQVSKIVFKATEPPQKILSYCSKKKIKSFWLYEVFEWFEGVHTVINSQRWNKQVCLRRRSLRWSVHEEMFSF